MSVTPNPAEHQLAEAYEKCSPGLLRHCRQHISDPEAARELVQDAFVRTWEYMQAGNKVDAIKTFLYRVLNNLIVDYVRKRKRQDTVSLDDLQEKGFDVGTDDTEQLHRSVDFWRTMGKLKNTEDYDLIVMRYVKGLRTTDIANVTGIPPNTIAVKIHRIVKSLMRKLHIRPKSSLAKKPALSTEHKNNA